MGGVFTSSKFQYMITSEKGFVHTRNDLDLIFFQVTIIAFGETCRLAS